MPTVTLSFSADTLGQLNTAVAQYVNAIGVVFTRHEEAPVEPTLNATPAPHFVDSAEIVAPTEQEAPPAKKTRKAKAKVEAEPSKDNGTGKVAHPAAPAVDVAALRSATTVLIDAIWAADDTVYEAAAPLVEAALGDRGAKKAADVDDKDFPSFAAEVDAIYAEHVG